MFFPSGKSATGFGGLYVEDSPVVIGGIDRLQQVQ